MAIQFLVFFSSSEDNKAWSWSNMLIGWLYRKTLFARCLYYTGRSLYPFYMSLHLTSHFSQNWTGMNAPRKNWVEVITLFAGKHAILLYMPQFVLLDSGNRILQRQVIIACLASTVLEWVLIAKKHQVLRSR